MSLIRRRSALTVAVATLAVWHPYHARAQTTPQNASPTAAPSYQVLFNRYQAPEVQVFIADVDGRDERRITSLPGIQYSPAFSADGQWIVFTSEQEGRSDIYRVRVDGTGLEQLTDHPAFDDQGTLSPDGQTLAFVSTRHDGRADIWLMDLASREATNLTATPSGDFRPSWSPDGEWIAFSSDRDSEPGSRPGQWEHLQSTGIYVIRRDGTGLRRLTREGGVAGSPSWSRDGRHVLYYETDEVGAYLAKDESRTELVSVDVETGVYTRHTASNETKLTPRWLSGGRLSYIRRGSGDAAGLVVQYPGRQVENVISGHVRGADWSPDERYVVYERIAQLGSSQHLLPTPSLDPAFELFLSEPFPTFSPDGTRLLYSQYVRNRSGEGALERSSAGDTSIEIMDSDGGDKRTLFHRDGYSAFSGVWSPDGSQIALSVGRYFRSPGRPPAQIALIRPDGSDFRLLLDDELNNGFPSWSPDGTRLVFKQDRHLAILSLTDGTITSLTEGPHYDNFPHWSPERDLILFTSNRDGDFDLYSIRPDGSDLRRLTATPGSNAHSAWCTGSDWIVFTSGRMGFKDEMALYDRVPQPYGEIFAMRADGSDLRQLTDNKWEDASATCR